MKTLLGVSRWIDRINTSIGELMSWAVLVVVLVSTGNALARKLFHTGSNAALEMQLYLFAAIFLLNGGYTLLRNEHIRIDVIFTRLSQRTRLWIDVLGILFFLLPMALMTAWMAMPLLIRTFIGQETSANAGGLLLWPAWALVPLGFGLLILQALSELVKRIAQLRGIPVPPPPGSLTPATDDPIASLAASRTDGEQK